MRTTVKIRKAQVFLMVQEHTMCMSIKYLEV